MTLANYLREIRATSFPYAKLGKAAINAASHDQLANWLAERKQHPARNMETADLKKSLLSFDSKMKPISQREIAERAGVSLFLVNKVFTSGKKIRGSGLKNILRAMGCSSDAPETRKALSIWASESGMAVEPEDVDGIVNEKHGELSSWWRKTSPHLMRMDSNQLEQLFIAISRPSVMAALTTLNSVYEASTK